MTQRQPLRVLLFFAGVALWPLGLTLPTRAADAPRFEPTACDDLPDIADVASRLRCGLVRVPSDRARPDSPTYALAVVVVASPRQPAEPDPVVYISGGPGSPLTTYTGYQARHPYAADRDLVLVDQRGMGRSEPRLCPETQGGLVNAMLAVVVNPTREALAESRAAHAACHASMRARGIDPDTFGTAVTVEDYEWVRRALGIARWNVVGESYGTTVAMTLLARHPESVRTAVLDSLNPPDAFFGMPWSARVARAREAFFAACASDPACAAVSPNLGDIYREALARLGRDAPPITLSPALRVPGDRVRLTPSLFEEVVGRLVYYPSAYAGLPHLVAATRNGDLGPVREALGTLLTGAARSGNEGAFAAVECRDRPRWREPAATEVSPLDLALLPPGVCEAWSTLGPEPEVPQDTRVPTLVLAGQFDPNIRPEQSRAVAERMGQHVRWVEFASLGHNVRHYSPCAASLVAAFIAHPDRRLDTACADKGALSGSKLP